MLHPPGKGARLKQKVETCPGPDSPTCDLLLPIFAWIGKQEAKRISERVLAGLDRAKAKGRFPGRPRIQREHDKDATVIRKMRDAG